jgi:hypothetical protein
MSAERFGQIVVGALDLAASRRQHDDGNITATLIRC